MKSLFQAVAFLIAIGLVTGCTGPRRFDRQSGTVRLPSAPVLAPSPDAIDPDRVGTVGEPAAAPAHDISAAPALSPFGE